MAMTMRRRRWFGAVAGGLAGASTAAVSASSLAAAGATFEIYQDAKKEYRWRLKAGNGQVIATSGQGYKAKADCRHGVEVVQAEAAKAKIEEVAAKE
jgi:uncharacterized protein YegP (UPF0339 family)